LRESTQRSYGHHIDDYLVPALGHLRLRDLRPVHVQQMLNRLTGPNDSRHDRKPATVRRIHATLRSAMSTAKRRRLIAFNPAVDIDLPNGSRPKVRPWEPSELGTFLDAIAGDSLATLFEVIAATGLRRGEALGLRWQDVNFEMSRLVVRQQVLELHGWQRPCAICGELHGSAVFGRPKTVSGEDRSVDLDSRVTQSLAEHRERQRAHRIDWADAYVDHGLVFARPGGDPHRPEWVSTRFHALVKDAGLRQIRLHDLRHGRASLLLAAGVDIALVSKVMGHSTIALTSDTYSHLLEGVGREAAERASALVPRRPKSASSAPL
jgi:integrase